MISFQSLDTTLRPILFFTVLLTVGGILFSMALSSVAFAISVLIFLTMLTAAWHGRRLPVFLTSNKIEWFFLAWVIAVLVMTAFARYPASALISAKRLLLISMVYMLPVVLRDYESVRRFLRLFAILAGLHSLAAIIVFFAGEASRLGVFQHYMTGGGIRMLLLLFLLPLVFERKTPTSDRIIFAVVLFCMMFALLLTQTRSSWLAFAAGALLLGILRYRIILLGMVVLAIVFWFTAPKQYQNRIRHMFTTDSSIVQGEVGDTEAVVGSNRSRLRMIETGWRMFLNHPFIGVGDGEMYSMYREYVPDAIKDEGGHLHNTYIHVLATHGAIGAVALLSLFFALGRLFVQSFRLYVRTPAGVIASGALAAYLGFLVNGFAEYNFGDHEIVLILWTITGLTSAVLRIERNLT